MDIASSSGPETLILAVSGLVDADNNYRIYEALIAACGPGTPLARVVLDVAGARFGDFAVTGLLRRLSERAAAAGARLELRGATGELVAMLGSCGLRADITLS